VEPLEYIEAGIILQRACLAAAALGLACRVICGYDVAAANAVLGLEAGPLRNLAQLLLATNGDELQVEQLLWTGT
jgi:nitroreductase